MITNPVYKRELMVSSRSARTSITITVFNLILAAIAMTAMSATIEAAGTNAQIQYSNFINILSFVASVEFILILLIVPAFTAGSISGERERRTMDLMLTTMMKPVDIILGKLFAAVSNIILLIISGIPVIATVFVYGGIMLKDLLIIFFCYFALIFFTGCIGIFSSCVCTKSVLSAGLSYGIVFVLVPGVYFLNIFTEWNRKYYLASLVLNPAMSFCSAMSNILGQSFNSVSMLTVPEYYISEPLFENWFIYGNLLQIAAGVLLIAISVRTITPAVKSRKKI